MRRALFASVACVALGFSPALAQMQGRGDNVPLGGGSGGGGAGTVTAIATSCGATGGTINTTGTISASVAANAQTGTSYTPLATDCGKLITLTNAGAIAITLTAANFAAGNFINFKNLPGAAGVATLTPGSGTIDGAVSLAIIPGQGLTAVFDGTNWITSGRYVEGPASSTTGHLATLSGTSGQLLADGGTVPPTHPGYKSTIWYQPLGSLTAGVSGAPALTTAYCSLGGVGGTANVTISALGTRITTVGSTNVQFAIYNDDATVSPHRPGTLVDSTPSVSNGASPASASLNSARSVAPGYYWFCIQTGDTTVRYLAKTATSTDLSAMVLAGSATLNNALVATTVSGGVSTTTGISPFGTWPANLNGSTWTEIGTTAPDIVFQVQ